MKKTIMIAAIMICTVLMGCSPVDTLKDNEITQSAVSTPIEQAAMPTAPQPTKTPSLFSVALTDLPELYAREDAIANGDYVYTSRGYANEDKMEAFLKAASAKETAAIRITRYTDEGDPIIADVVFDGSKFTVWNDTTRDKFGPQELTQSVYNYLLEYEYQGRTALILTNEAEMTDEIYLYSSTQFMLKFWDSEE